ncbi:MAG: hypothetical protein WKF89_05655 [Chitinophagaceae bacterium]
MNEFVNVSPAKTIGEKDGMELFADLVAELGTTTKTNDKLDALVNYFAAAPTKDKAAAGQSESLIPLSSGTGVLR